MNFLQEPGRTFLLDGEGRLAAEVTYPEQKGVAVMNHTFVDPSLRGQGVAEQLVKSAADTLRARGCKVRPTCSYAVRWFETHPEYADLLE